MTDPRPVRDTSLFKAPYGAFNRGDIETPLELYSEDCVWDMSRFPGSGLGVAQVYRGDDGRRQFLEECRAYTEPWGGARAEFGRVLDLGGGRFRVEGKNRFSSPGGDAELLDDWIQLVAVRDDGKVAEVDMHRDPDEARRAAGLETVPAP